MHIHSMECPVFMHMPVILVVVAASTTRVVLARVCILCIHHCTRGLVAALPCVYMHIRARTYIHDLLASK